MAPFTLKLPFIDIELSTFAPKFSLRSSVAVMSAVFPFHAVYMSFDAILHPKRTFTFAKSRKDIRSLLILFVLLLLPLAVVLIFPRLAPSPLLAYTIIIPLLICIISTTLTVLIANEKSETPWASIISGFTNMFAIPFLLIRELDNNLNGGDT